jgi:DNA polymerase-4
MPSSSPHRSARLALQLGAPPAAIASTLLPSATGRQVCEHVFVSPVRSEASVLHADLDAFFASVEQRDDPSLRGKPVIVGSGVVMAASYEARACGVRSAMGGRQALALCPEAVVVVPRMDAYSEASRAVFDVFHDTTPEVEPLSIDEAFLDVGGLGRVSGPPTDVAVALRTAVRDRVGLPITVGVARTKFLAKVASREAKPDGLLVVAASRELAFLHPLPVDRLWSVGPKTTAKLHARGISRVGEVAALDEAVLVAMLGPAAGRHLHALAHNCDPRPVVTGRRRRSMGAQRALGRSRRPPGELEAVLDGLLDGIARRLRAARVVGRTVVLRIRFDDFRRASRTSTLPIPTAHTAPLRRVARQLLEEVQPLVEVRGLTLVGLAVCNLSDADAVQLPLPFDDDRDTALDQALDAVRDRFGSSAVGRAALLGKDRGWSMPRLPES